MLLLRIAADPHQPGRSIISASDAGKGAGFLLSTLGSDEVPWNEGPTFWAEGEIQKEEFDFRTFTYHRFILSPDFNVEDIQMFGRYGILEIGDAPFCEDATGSGRIYISGGKQADTNSSLGNMLRLSRKDHRQLISLVRRHDKLSCELVTGNELAGIEIEPVLLRSKDSSALSRLLRYAPTFPLAASPFLIPHVAEAQCINPDSGNYDSGTNYSGVDFSKIQSQEEITTFANVPDNKSGATLAGGLDLGQQSAASLTAMGISQSLVDQFTPFYGLTGAAAQAAIDANTAAAGITDAEATQIDNAIYPAYSTAAATAFNNASPNMNFTDLNVQWQTVMVSMYFNGGPKVTGTQFWSQVANGQWAAAIANLQHFGGPSIAQNKRAAKNAAYLVGNNCTVGTSN